MVYRSAEPRFFPLTPRERERLRTLGYVGGAVEGCTGAGPERPKED